MPSYYDDMSCSFVFLAVYDIMINNDGTKNYRLSQKYCDLHYPPSVIYTTMYGALIQYEIAEERVADHKFVLKYEGVKYESPEIEQILQTNMTGK